MFYAFAAFAALKRVAILLLTILFSISVAQAQTTFWGNSTFGSSTYRTDPIEACKQIIIGVQSPLVEHLYYKGYLFDSAEAMAPLGATRDQVRCKDSNDNTVPIWEWCGAPDPSSPDPNDPIPISTENRACEVECETCRETAGNPTEIVTGVKTEVATDWVSSKDPRFSLKRYYRSDDIFKVDSELGNNEYFMDMAGVWKFSQTYHAFEERNRNQIWYQEPDGATYYFDVSGSSIIPRSPAPEFKITRTERRHNWFYRIPGIWFETPRQFAVKLEKFSGTAYQYGLKEKHYYPDGYRIRYGRSGSYGGYEKLTHMVDDQGQRINFIRSSSAVPNSSLEVVVRAEIDTDYSGTFAPEVKIHYTYEQNTRDPNRPKLVEVESEDVASGVTKTIWKYTYLPDNETTHPRLASISDGRTDSGGQHFAYANFTYEAPLTSPRVSRSEYVGAVNDYDFTRTGDLATVTGPLGKTREYDIDEVGGFERIDEHRALAATNSLGTTRTTGYVPNTGAPEGYVYERVERNGSRTTYDRDAQGLVLTKTEDADGTDPRVTTYTWDVDARKPLTRTTDHLIETFTYANWRKNLVGYAQTDNLSGSPTFGTSRNWTYTNSRIGAQFDLLTALDGPGQASNGVTDIWTYAYDSHGLLTSTTDPNGLTTTINSRSIHGLPATVTMPDGVEWSFAYDYEGRLTTATRDPSGTPQTTTYAYDEIGQMTSMTDRRGQTWDFEYDQAKRLVKTTAPSGDVIDYTHDAMGNVTRMEYANGSNPATFYQDTEFDELGRIMKSLGAHNQETDFDYDVEDNLTHVTDALNYQTVRGFDALNRVTSVVDRANYTTTMEVDEADQVTKYTDPRTIATDFVYNGFGEVIQEISQDRGTISYTYNDRGLVASMTDARGVVTNYEYDDGGRLTARRFPATPAEDQTFTYDYVNGGNVAGRGKPDTTTDPSGTSTARYSQGTGLIDTDTRVIEGQSYVTSYDFDAEDAVSKITYPSGHELSITRDVDGRITDLSFDLMGGGGATSVISGATYLPNGPVSSMTYGDGAVHTATYDSSYRLTGLEDDLSGTLLRDITMGWTDRDNVASILDQIDSLRNQTFTYSARELLASATGPYDQLDFNYDGVGNRISKAVVTGTTATDTYTYATGNNRLASIAEAGGHTRAFTYDAAGNVTYDNRSGGGYGFAYDAANRMSEFSINGVVQAEYVYNAAGQQVIRRLTQAGQTIHALFDLDGNRIAEYDYDPIAQTSTLLREYLWMDGRAVAVVEGGTIYYVRTDHIGRPSFATDGVGAVQWEATYLPFGGVHTSTGSPIALRFPGQWFQSESGLHQNWMRDYDPTTGRYIQADPLGLVDGASVYGYALQNPMRWTDPRGEQTRPFPLPLPPQFIPGTDEATAAGKAIVDLLNPFPLINAIIDLCTPDPEQGKVCTLRDEKPIPGTKLNACYYDCPDGTGRVTEVPANIPGIVGSCPIAIPFI